MNFNSNNIVRQKQGSNVAQGEACALARARMGGEGACYPSTLAGDDDDDVALPSARESKDAGEGNRFEEDGEAVDCLLPRASPSAPRPEAATMDARRCTRSMPIVTSSWCLRADQRGPAVRVRKRRRSSSKASVTRAR